MLFNEKMFGMFGSIEVIAMKPMILHIDVYNHVHIWKCAKNMTKISKTKSSYSDRKILQVFSFGVSFDHSSE